jgi:magnesium transporter
MTDSRFYFFSPTKPFYGVTTPEEAISLTKEGGFVWLNYLSPQKEELSALIDLLGIHPLSVEDCTDEQQVPKIEHFPKSTFIIFNAFDYSKNTLSIDEVNFFIGSNFLITVSGNHSDGRRPLKGIEGVVELDMESVKNGPAFLMHVILDHIVDRKFSAIEQLEEELDSAEETLLADASGFNPSELVSLRRNLLNLRKSLFHEREILVKICRNDCPFIPEKTIIHYRDIYDHLAKFLELAETYREIVTSLMELYTSLLNNLMTRTSNETNSAVRRLTFISTIFLPLTLLASIGGMSEWSMMTGSSNWKVTYPLFIFGMVVIGLFNYYFLKRLEKKQKTIEKM